MSICILAAGKMTVLAGAGFTLAWTHSVEKTRWEEEWIATSRGLQLVEARIQGAGAGMEPPDTAVLRNGWWTYVPRLAPQPKLVLGASGATGQGWTLCTPAGCAVVGTQAGQPVVVTSCDGPAP